MTDAAEREIAVDLQQIVARAANDVGLTEVVVELAAGADRQRSHRQRSHRAGCRPWVQRGAGPERHRAADGARSAERAPAFAVTAEVRERAVDAQRSRSDRRRARVSAGTGEYRRTRADLVERSGARDDAGEGERVAAIEGQRAVVRHVTGDGSRRAAIPELQGARG